MKAKSLTLNHTLSGNPSAPSCLLFIHGFACDANDWYHQVAYFAHDYQILTCSLRGHGKSDRADSLQQFDIPTLAQDIVNLLDKLMLNKKIIAIGHSMGARVALELSYLVAQSIKGLILIDCGYSLVTNPDFNEIQNKLFPNDFQSSMLELFRQMFLANTSKATQDHVISNISTFRKAVGLSLLPNTILYDYYTMGKVLKLIDIPILAIQASLRKNGNRCPISDVTNAHSEWLDLLKNLPTVKIKLIPNCGHFIMLEQAEITNLTISTFLLQSNLQNS